jgi:hypothetical protein
MVGPQHVSFGKTHSVFIATNTLVFTLIVQRLFSLFLVLHLAFIFHLDFCLELISYL